MEMKKSRGLSCIGEDSFYYYNMMSNLKLIKGKDIFIYVKKRLCIII